MFKKIVSLFCSALLVLTMLTGCQSVKKVIDKFKPEETGISGSLEDTQKEDTSGKEETATDSPATETIKAPQVITYYTVKKLVTKDEVDIGFDVEIPKIVTDNPGAEIINTKIDIYKVKIEKEYAKSGNLAEYDKIIKCNYKTAVKDNLLFISVYTSGGVLYSEGFAENYHYAYDYVEDRELSTDELIDFFGMNKDQILTKVNTALVKEGMESVAGFDKISLFVDENGKICVDTLAPSMLGPEYPFIVILD